LTLNSYQRLIPHNYTSLLTPNYLSYYKAPVRTAQEPSLPLLWEQRALRAPCSCLGMRGCV
jgi:hypothetical protein